MKTGQGIVFLGLLVIFMTFRAAAAAPATGWQYQNLEEKTLASYDLRFTLKTADATAGMFRLIIGDPQRNAFYVEAGPGGVRSGRIVANSERGAERQSPAALADIIGKEIIFEQRPARWSLAVDGKILAADADVLPVGVPIGFGSNAGEFTVDTLKFQPAPAVRFSDNFMRAQKGSIWSELSGAWKIKTLDNPLLSANAFQYIGCGKAAESGKQLEAALSLAGEWFWSDLKFRVACKTPSEGAVGEVFACRAPNDYFLFKWTSRKSDNPCRQIIHCINGEEKIIAETPGGFVPGQWYALTVLVGPGRVEAVVDDTSLIRANDPAISCGKIGLYAEGAAETTFDDVLVEGYAGGHEDFERICTGHGLISGGEWIPVAASAEGWNGGVAARAQETARLIWGSPSWRDYSVQADIGPLSGGTAGICLRYQDEKNYWLAALSDGTSPKAEILRVHEGKREVVGSAPLPMKAEARRVEITSQGPQIGMTVDGKPVLGATDDSSFEGRIGLYAEGTGYCLFGNVLHDFIGADTPLTVMNESFSAEPSMDMWSDALSDWVHASGKPAIPSRYGKNRLSNQAPSKPEAWWHRSDFYGDARVEGRASEPPQDGAVIEFHVSALTTKPETGFTARIARKEETNSSSGCMATLTGPDGAALTAPLDWAAGPMTLSLGRSGRMIALLADGHPVLSALDERETPGTRLGWYSSDGSLEPGEVRLYSKNIMDYTFNSAPTDWRMPSGIWEVSNKWQCDPRWSFFSGRQRNGIASIWNKRPLSGDFTIEFYIGNKMDNSRDSTGRYSYAQDMDLTVCADGDNLDSGYSFLFGGFDNTVTGVYKGREKWAAPAAGSAMYIDRNNLHQKWYHIAVSRRGNRFEMRVDDKLVLSQEDPTPLTGGYWALWTRDNGIMIARVRICAEKIGECESPELVRPSPARSIYD